MRGLQRNEPMKHQGCTGSVESFHDRQPILRGGRFCQHHDHLDGWGRDEERVNVSSHPSGDLLAEARNEANQ